MPEDHLSRRRFLGRAGVVAGAAALGPAAALADAAKNQPATGGKAPHPANPDAALKLLLKGNKRYQKDKLELRDYSPVGEDRAERQMPFAAIITCADSRVSPTLIFDVERGNIFVSKVAGNSIDTGTLGSTEYGVAVLGVKLIMVLGHSNCGAVKSGIDVANGTTSFPPAQFGAIGPVVDLVVPPISAIPPAQRTLDNSIAANARYQAATIAAKDPIVKPAIAAGTIKVVAAVYNIANGKVSLV
jgi:carbonic anhydrase